MQIQDIVYNLSMPLLRPLFSHVLYNLKVTGNPIKGPGLMVAPHLFAIDPFVVCVSVPDRVVPIYITPTHGRRGREFSHFLATVSGIDSTLATFTDDLYEAYARGRVSLAFPQGDNPRKAMRSARNGSLLPYEIPVRTWSPMIFEHSLDYENSSGIELLYQPVGLDYGKEVKCYKGSTVLWVWTHVNVDFGEPRYSNGTDALTLGNDIMREATLLSRRTYDGRYHRRMAQRRITDDNLETQIKV